MNNVILDNLNMTNTEIKNSSLNKSDLSPSTFSNCTLNGVSMMNVDMSNITMTNTDILINGSSLSTKSNKRLTSDISLPEGYSVKPIVYYTEEFEVNNTDLFEKITGSLFYNMTNPILKMAHITDLPNKFNYLRLQFHDGDEVDRHLHENVSYHLGEYALMDHDPYTHQSLLEKSC